MRSYSRGAGLSEERPRGSRLLVAVIVMAGPAGAVRYRSLRISTIVAAVSLGVNNPATREASFGGPNKRGQSPLGRSRNLTGVARLGALMAGGRRPERPEMALAE